MNWTNQGGFPSGGASASAPGAMPQLKLLERDAATWGMTYSLGSYWWDSAKFGQSQTGSIVFGLIPLSRLLHLCIGGHGATNECHVDILDELDLQLWTSTVSALILSATGNALSTANPPIGVTINTAAHLGVIAKIRLRDAHSGGNGWCCINPAYFQTED